MKDRDTAAEFNVETMKRSALRVAQRMQLMHPELTFRLYTAQWNCYLVAECAPALQAAIAAQIEEIKPLAWPLEFSLSAPPHAKEISIDIPLAAEIWGAYEPLTLTDVRRALSIAAPNLPNGEIRLDNTRQVWQFRSPGKLNADEEHVVKEGLRKLGQYGEIEFVLLEGEPRPTLSKQVSPQFPGRTFDIFSSLELKSDPNLDLVKKDEEIWLQFLERRAQRKLDTDANNAPTELACTWDSSDQSDVRLAELLVLYDRIDCIAPLVGFSEGGLLRRLDVSEPEFQELVAKGRLRLVLPHSVQNYDSRTLQLAKEVNPDSLILSRALAAATVEQGQRKDPLLYGPLSVSERTTLIKGVLDMLPADHSVLTILKSYLKVFEFQSLALMGRGAMALASSGVGVHLSKVLQGSPNFRHDLEFSVIGAQVEWSIGLGSTYVPPMLGTYATDDVATFIASFHGGGTRSPQTMDPAANRIHTVVNSLLVPSDVPAIEVARNLELGTLNRFRSTAKGLMSQTANVDEIRAAVAELNKEIQTYEKRSARLRTWGVGALVATVGGDAISDAVTKEFGKAASLLAMWLGGMLLERRHLLGREFNEQIESVLDTLRGLFLAPSLDAVIVRRARNQLVK